MPHFELVPFLGRFWALFAFMGSFVWLGGMLLFNRYGVCDNFVEAVFCAVLDLLFIAFVCAVAAVQI
jgi:hypothetical protein